MKKKIFIPVLVLIFGVLLFATSFEGNSAENDEPMYVGVDKCAGTCHKGDSKGNQYEIWQNSKHSNAFKNLQTPEADKIAQDRGYSTPAAETPECVKCHTLGIDLSTAPLTDTYDKTQGVQCETCHGPGSEYKKLNIMKDVELAKQNGLIIHTEREAFCTGCHNSQSPTFKSFDYDEMWAKIKHPKPQE
ncbi:MAG: cytochrome C554 [Ignavibacteriae bacterium]|nr:cytochrome C554 [Ignavibacteriota bacterium]MCB9244217.1 cytochrome C554 [Ignavibacteriales bacterium]